MRLSLRSAAGGILAAPLSGQDFMPNGTPQSSDSTPIKASRTLTDRVKERVAEAGRAHDRRGLAGPKPKKKATRLDTPTSGPRASSESQREAKSLVRVYRELKGTYQQYRRETGRSAEPALREAVQAFKRGPSLTSLVGVAVFLDDRSLLPW
jgi:hypothetical protein